MQINLCHHAELPGKAAQIRQAHLHLAAIQSEWVRRRLLEPNHDTWLEPATTAGADNPRKGILASLGYALSENRSAKERRWLLDAILTTQLPPVVDRDYVESWGEPSSKERFDKVIRSLRGFASRAYGVRGREIAREIWLRDAVHLEKNWLN
ncbi:hypothetical protein [Erythrobacter aurantius]|uniref:hypothetical protein n=1 Tax=Erythrobacter aurantius TaxID=2909249 RepID=UPI00207B07DE|nr:hypothetical protein [Erythrobacter aurantius]